MPLKKGKGGHGLEYYSNRDGKYVGGENDNDKIFDYEVSMPLFENEIFPRIQKEFPNYLVSYERGTTEEDKKYGIDYRIKFLDKETKEEFYRTIDLKCITNTLGNPQQYNNPNIALNLIKQANDDGKSPRQWIPSSHTNKQHKNSHYGFIIASSNMTKDQMVDKLKKDPNAKYEDFGIGGISLFVTKASSLKKYFQERLFDNDDYKKEADLQIQAASGKIDWLTDVKSEPEVDQNGNRNFFARKVVPDKQDPDWFYTMQKSFPIAGEKASAKLVMQWNPGQGRYEQRVFFPSRLLTGYNFQNTDKSEDKRPLSEPFKGIV